MILEYFGEKQPTEHCGACDNCLGLKEKKETVDLTVAAQKFLSAIIRTSERFGATYITDVLTGNEKEERIIHNRHHTLPVFGIGADMKKTEWQHIARELEQEDYLVRDEEFGSLKLTTIGATALADRSPIHLVPIPVKVRQTKEEKQKAKASSAGISSTEPHEELFQLLRSVRKELAEQHNVPPYIIFHDSVLREVSKKMPRTLRQLDTIPGMGESKKKNYGEKIVAAVNTFCAMKKVA
jgi:ATP-dependent DNA helicase RecQ